MATVAALLNKSISITASNRASYATRWIIPRFLVA
jgi:hypothetical protein